MQVLAMSNRLNLWLGRALVFLALTAVYLYGFPAPTLFYESFVLFHVVAGVAFTLLLAWFVFTRLASVPWLAVSWCWRNSRPDSDSHWHAQPLEVLAVRAHCDVLRWHAFRGSVVAGGARLARPHRIATSFRVSGIARADSGRVLGRLVDTRHRVGARESHPQSCHAAR